MNHAQIAENFANWNEYFNTDGAMTESEFDALNFEERVALLEEAFGKEAVE